MNDEMPEMAWSERAKLASEVMNADVMGPWLEVLEGWVSQAKSQGYTDEQARFAVLHLLGWRPARSADGGEPA